MKCFHIDLESVNSTRWKSGKADIWAAVKVEELADAELHSVLRMSEETMRRLHKLLGNHIAHLDEKKAR